MAPDDDASPAEIRGRIHLGLQGGGAHGALTWGVLDRLLEDGRLDIAAISGTSAGAMNAVVLADGFAEGGPEGARAALERFWRAVGDAARFSPLRPGAWGWLRGAPGWLSPSTLNPMGLNPLRVILEAQVDLERVNAGPIDLHVVATQVRTGLPRVFGRGEITADAVLASACLPQLFQAVEIDGEPYWDGGYSANPALLPLIEGPGSRDILIVQINPALRSETPATHREILDRVSEIGFNASLLKELAALDWMARQGAGPRVRLHLIDGAAGMADEPASGKLDASWAHLAELFERGRSAADGWLATDAAEVGSAGTFDFAARARATMPPGAEPPRPRRRARRWSWRWPLVRRAA
jgi:NTE family protein